MKKKMSNDNENVSETLGLIDFDGIDINQHGHMTNAYNNLQKN